MQIEKAKFLTCFLAEKTVLSEELNVPQKCSYITNKSSGPYPREEERKKRAKCCQAREKSLAILRSIGYSERGTGEEQLSGFSSQGRAKLRAFPRNFTAESTQLSPSLTQKPCIAYSHNAKYC